MMAAINPDSGPGKLKDPNYVRGIQILRSSGIVVIGYVHTDYARRRKDEVMAEIDSYNDWYEIDGIAFDEMSNTPGHEEYYSDASRYARSHGLTVTVGNPGTETFPSYFGTVNTLVIYEGYGLPAPADFAGWNANLGKANFGMIAYGVGKLVRSAVREASRYLGYIYVTDDTLPNPYDTLPSYFSVLVSALDLPSVDP